jgi:hypothetical protein
VLGRECGLKWNYQWGRLNFLFLFFSIYYTGPYTALRRIHVPLFFSPLPTSLFTRSRAADTSELVHLRPFPYHLCEWKAYLKRTSECQRIQMQDTRRHSRLIRIFCTFPSSCSYLLLLLLFSPFNARRNKRGGETSCPDASRVP